jgi:hypothetical protein
VRVADRAATLSAPVEALDAGLAHQSGDALEVDRQAEPEGELGVYPRRAVRPAGLGVNLFDVFEQQFVLLGSGGFRAGAPCVVARSRHVQYLAGHRDIHIQVGVVGEFTDQRED